MTREDAVKRLNTQVLAGEGPDILLLDGLPAETYMEKGMLKDIRPILEGLPEEEALFANVVDSFTDGDGAVYTMPMCIRVPLLVGDREQIAGMNDLERIAAKMENRRAEYPQEGSLGSRIRKHSFGFLGWCLLRRGRRKRDSWIRRPSLTFWNFPNGSMKRS